MKRSVEALRDAFDLLVIGGGIYGAWTAYDASLRGLKVALIDKGDWASGTSSASTKLIHGGLRYLERLAFGLVKKSLDERRRLVRLGPHRVTPCRFVVPLYPDAGVAQWRLRAGLWLYDRLAGSNQPVAAHGRLTRVETLARYGFLRDDGLDGAFTYGDCQTDDARFTLEVVSGAHAAGAVVANYCEARELTVARGRVVGAVVTDHLGGDTLEVRTKVVVNATGAWEVGGIGKRHRVRLTKGVHIVMPRLATDDAFLFMTKRDRRVFFMIPWYGKMLVGTTDTNFDGDPDDVSVTEEDVSYLLSESRRYLRDDGWRVDTMLGRFAGLRALYDGGDARSPSDVSREWVVDETTDVLTSIGGKFTSAREDASTLVDRVMRRLGRKAGRSQTATAPLPWCPPGDFAAWRSEHVSEGIRLGLDEDVAVACVGRYGRRVETVYRRLREDPGLAERVAPEAPFCLAEVAHAFRDEMALTLEDVLRRRVPLALLTHPDRGIVERFAAIAARELEWSNETQRERVESALAAWLR